MEIFFRKINLEINKFSFHFKETLLNKWHIMIYQQDELVDKGGLIKKTNLPFLERFVF